MNKKYQVFISSTFTDLKEERALVSQALMGLECIPAGMEFFPAVDEDQLNFIKKVIDDCDYYVLIIGGRYGSVALDGLSYTEKEYNYAVEKGKRVIAFVHKDPDLIPLGKSEKEVDLQQKLAAFCKRVKSGRIVKEWSDPKELAGLVTMSLALTIKMYPTDGWIRGNSVTNPEILLELNELRKKNLELKDKIESFHQQFPILSNLEGLSGLDDEFEICGVIYLLSDMMDRQPWKGIFLWKEIFSLISPHLLIPKRDSTVRKLLTAEIFKKTRQDELFFDFSIDDESYQTIKIHLRTLGVVDIIYRYAIDSVSYTSDPDKDSIEDDDLIWRLTREGSDQMMRIKGAKQKNN